MAEPRVFGVLFSWSGNTAAPATIRGVLGGAVIDGSARESRGPDPWRWATLVCTGNASETVPSPPLSREARLFGWNPELPAEAANLGLPLSRWLAPSHWI
ncbi:UNVERIFIED_CONTAM: hypothetical protein K2H54_045962 [Gekko kuhli]